MFLNETFSVPPILLANQYTLTTLSMVAGELARARSKHPKVQSSRHEGIAILEEEFLEAREAVFRDRSSSDVLKELVQVAAMACRMIEDLKLSEAADAEKAIRNQEETDRRNREAYYQL